MPLPKALFLLTLLLAFNSAHAGKPPPMPAPLQNLIENSNTILIVSLTQFTPDAPPPLTLTLTDSSEFGSVIRQETFRQPGTYTFKTLQTLKGRSPDTLEIHLPLFSAYYYGSSRFRLPPDSHILLLLKKDSTGAWAPTDPLMPLIPLSDKVPATREAKSPDTLDLLLESLPDPTFRPTLSHILRTIKDPRILPALRPFAEDADLQTRANILESLLLNDDPTAAAKMSTLKNSPHLHIINSPDDLHPLQITSPSQFPGNPPGAQIRIDIKIMEIGRVPNRPPRHFINSPLDLQPASTQMLTPPLPSSNPR